MLLIPLDYPANQIPLCNRLDEVALSGFEQHRPGTEQQELPADFAKLAQAPFSLL